MRMTTRMIRIAKRLVPAALILFCAVQAKAEATNNLADSEMEGRKLAQQLWSLEPAENVTNTGTLKIRTAKTPWSEMPIRFCVSLFAPAAAGWEASYETTGTNREQLVITHSATRPNRYRVTRSGKTAELTGAEANVPFAGSDFSVADLGLEFLAWPSQKIIKKEFHDNVASILLESRNPNPGANDYSRVISRIEEESGGVMEAHAYDASDKAVKDFTVKSLKKINDHWQVESMIMENRLTGSRTRLEFDLPSK